MKQLLIIDTHFVQYRVPVYQELCRRNISIHVIYGCNNGAASYHDKEFGKTLAWDTDLTTGHSHSVLSQEKVEYENISSQGLEEEFAKREFDAILLTGYSREFYKKALELSLATGKPILYRVEASDKAHKYAWWKSKLRDFYLKKMYKSFSRFLYIGQEAKSHYLRLGVPESKLYFSPYCVSTGSFRLTEVERESDRIAFSKEFPDRDGRFVLVYCGKLSERKGLLKLMEVALALPEDVKRKLFLLFVGDGELRNQLTEQLQQDRFLTCYFAGFKNQSEISYYYNGSDGFVLPSIVGETWGLVVNEALHHGLPVLVSDKVGCSTDFIVSDAIGTIFSHDKPGDLSEKLIGFISNRSNHNNQKERLELIERYTVAHSATGIIQALESL